MFSTVPPPKRVSRLMHAARYRPSRRTTAVILWHSLLECLLALVLLFGATTFVRWVVGLLDQLQQHVPLVNTTARRTSVRSLNCCVLVPRWYQPTSSTATSCRAG